MSPKPEIDTERRKTKNMARPRPFARFLKARHPFKGEHVRRQFLILALGRSKQRAAFPAPLLTQGRGRGKNIFLLASQARKASCAPQRGKGGTDCETAPRPWSFSFATSSRDEVPQRELISRQQLKGLSPQTSSHPRKSLLVPPLSPLLGCNPTIPLAGGKGERPGGADWGERSTYRFFLSIERPAFRTIYQER